MKFWIAHPEADGSPVPFWRWLCWRYAEALSLLLYKLSWHHSRMEERALYGEVRTDDDIPF